MSTDRPLLGIALMLGFCVLAPLGDGLAKLLGQSVPVFQILLARFLAQLVVLAPLAALSGQSLVPPKGVRALVVWRTCLHIAGIAAMFTALLYLPLADAVAIAFVMPFLMLVLGHFVMGEEVGARRALACLVGFVGTLMVIQPAFAAVGWPALLPLSVAVIFAFFMMATRQIAQKMEAVALQGISGAVAVAILVPVALVGPTISADWAALVPVDVGTAVTLCLLGVIGAIAHLAMTWSLRYAPASTLAPMQYLEIPFATALGFVMFGDFPNGLAALGIIVILSAGLYVIARERQVESAAMSPGKAARGATKRT